MKMRMLISRRSIGSLLLLTSLLSRCEGIYPDHDHMDIDGDYLPEHDPTEFADDYVSNSDECALRLERSYSPRITDPFLQNSNRHARPARVVKCISYENVNEALRKAKRDLKYEPSDIDPLNIIPDELDTIANVFIETSRNLAETFQLSREEINYALPSINTSKTDIWDMCPDMYKPTTCTASRFRTMNGRCSSLQNSVMGMATTPFKRFLPAVFADNISTPKVSPIDGSPLPHVRMISIKVHPDISQLSDSLSMLLMAWGQFFGHDLLLTDFPRVENGETVFCCTNETNLHRYCNPITIPETDPFYSRHNSTCMEFLRTLAGIKPRCTLGPREINNFVTSRLDANFLYGNSDSEARYLRVGSKGLMKTWPKFRHLGLKDLLPPKTEMPENTCIARPRNKYCFLTGDVRASFQPLVAMLHILYVREHNRIATELGYLNPHWDDERIYQETRHIMIATIQHSAYNELLPLLVGPEYLNRYNLTLQNEGYWYGYENSLPIYTHIAIQAAAFRFGHTLPHNNFRLYDKYHRFVDSWELHTVIAQPFNLYTPGIVDKVIGGSVNSPIEKFDRFMTTELTKRLFQTPDTGFGRDLASLNINRGRDQAIPGYNDYREWCGLSRAKTFEELDYYLRNFTAFEFSNVYRHPDEIDLWSAAISEYPVEGGILGPTFSCIISKQMSNQRRADRFWYETPGFPSSFTPGQLREIRKVTVAKIMCENADDFPTIQKWAMEMPHPQYNPRYFCTDLPHINLEFWIEDPDTREFKYLK